MLPVPATTAEVTGEEAMRSPCWFWQDASLNPKGYAQVSRGRTRSGHRAVYTLLVGPVPAGMVIDHLCRTPNCVNPDHLEVVTNAENILRGVSFSAVNAKKTKCPKGHPLDGVRRDRVERYCRTCDIARKRLARRREKL